MDQYCGHQKTNNEAKKEFYFFTWSIPCINLVDNLAVKTERLKLKNGCTLDCTLNTSKDCIKFKIESASPHLKCFVSFLIGSKTLLLSKCLNNPTYDNSTLRTRASSYYYSVELSSKQEGFQKLKQHLKNSLVLTCKIIYSDNSISTKSMKTSNTICSMDNFDNNLKILADDLKSSSHSLSSEKVLLRVGEETETVSKAILCARSPVFAKMFESDMKEMYENTVTITDIKMPILKMLIHFMYTRKLSNGESDYNLDFLCDLYYATDKYEITDLRQFCVDLILPQISTETLNQIMKLAHTHNDILLKSAVSGFISTNIETWFSTENWKHMIDNEPEIATEVLNFLDF